MLALWHTGRNLPWYQWLNAAEREKLRPFGAVLKGVLYPTPGSRFSLIKKSKFLASRKSELKGTQLNPSHNGFTTPQQIRKALQPTILGNVGSTG